MSIERTTALSARRSRWRYAALVLAPLLVGSSRPRVSPERSVAESVAHRAMEPAGAQGGGKKGGGGNLIDHGGVVLDSSATYAIYWGRPSDFPGDLETGMEELLSGFSGSSYLGIATEYMRGAAVSTAYGGSLIDT